MTRKPSKHDTPQERARAELRARCVALARQGVKDLDIQRETGVARDRLRAWMREEGLDPYSFGRDSS